MSRIIARAATIAIAGAALAATCFVAPASASHTLSITITPADGVWGTDFNIRGFTQSNTEVKLQRRYAGGGWADLPTRATANSDGFFSFHDEPLANAHYRAVAVSDGATSNGVFARVRVGVHIGVDTSGSRAVFFGRVLPAQRGTRVILQMFDGNDKVWRNVASGRLSSSSRYSIAYRAPGTGRRLFRVAWPTQTTTHDWNVSAWASVAWVTA